MSEPRDGSAPGSEWTPTQPNADALPEGASDSLEQPEAEAAEAPVARDAPGAPEAPVGAAPAPPQASWVTPPASGGRSRGCYVLIAVAAFFVVALPVLAIALLIFLGGQVQNILGGTMEFGTGGTGCAVTGEATSFPSSTSIRLVAFLERDVVDGETITTAVTYPNGTTETSNDVWEEGGRCVSETLPPGLAPGRYVIEYRAGTTVLSRGELTITP